MYNPKRHKELTNTCQEGIIQYTNIQSHLKIDGTGIQLSLSFRGFSAYFQGANWLLVSSHKSQVNP